MGTYKEAAKSASTVDPLTCPKAMGDLQNAFAHF